MIDVRALDPCCVQCVYGMSVSGMMYCLIRTPPKYTLNAKQEVELFGRREGRFGMSSIELLECRGGECTVLGFCDNSVREKGWRCRKRGTQAT